MTPKTSSRVGFSANIILKSSSQNPDDFYQEILSRRADQERAKKSLEALRCEVKDRFITPAGDELNIVLSKDRFHLMAELQVNGSPIGLLSLEESQKKLTSEFTLM